MNDCESSKLQELDLSFSSFFNVTFLQPISHNFENSRKLLKRVSHCSAGKQVSHHHTLLLKNELARYCSQLEQRVLPELEEQEEAITHRGSISENLKL